MILHIPHSSRVIPPDLRPTLRLTKEDLNCELLRMTDAWTDELFQSADRIGREAIVFPVSRLVVDPERFEHDEQEPMALKGMGAVYMKTSDGTQLRDLHDGEREALLERFYRPHHRALEAAVDRELSKTGRALIIDCHSFPAEPLPFEDSSLRRPEICVGFDEYHKSVQLVSTCVRLFKEKGCDVDLNTPFSGALVPSRWSGPESLVHSIMIEVRRDLYMDESTGERLPRFAFLRGDLLGILDELGKVELA